MSDATFALSEAIWSKNDDKIEECKRNFLESAKDPISQWLDKEKGSTVKDNDIFISLPRYWEGEFQKDMKALNV